MKFKVGDKVKVIDGDFHKNNSPELKTGYIGIITEIKEISAIFPGNHWIDIDGYGGIIESQLMLVYTSWRDRYE